MRGRPRKVRETDGDPIAPGAVGTIDPAQSVIKTEFQVRTRDGEAANVPMEGFDFSKLNSLKPFDYDTDLPPAEIKYDRKGRRVLVKNGEPRFFFRGTHLIKIYHGLSGKKTDLWKRFKPEKKRLDLQIMTYLKKRGVQEVYG